MQCAGVTPHIFLVETTLLAPHSALPLKRDTNRRVAGSWNVIWYFKRVALRLRIQGWILWSCRFVLPEKTVDGSSVGDRNDRWEMPHFDPVQYYGGIGRQAGCPIPIPD